MSFRTLALVLPFAVAAAACSRPPEAAPAEPQTPAVAPLRSVPTPTPRPRSPGSNLPVLEILSEGGEVRDGVLTVDAYERDRVWLGVVLDTEAGEPLPGKTVSFATDGPAQIIQRRTETDADGYLEFEVLVGPPGTQTVTVTAAGVSREFRLNVIPNDFDQWLVGLPQEGLTRWNTLMEARVSAHPEGGLKAEFPESIRALNGQTVTLGGFMLPLEPAPQQRHFLLSAAPPNCFFHLPGGPSTVVEVFAETPVLGSFDPLLVEGVLELVEVSELGVLYRLQKARPGGRR